MGKKKTKNDIAWEQLFETYPILEEVEKNGFATITADEIKTAKREPRLMTKFDSMDDLPEIFQKNHLAILPTERGTYIIGKFQNYYPITISDDVVIETKYLPDWITTIRPESTPSEAISLSAAYLSKMIDDIAEEEVYPSIQGRMGTESFSYEIQNSDGTKATIDVKNAQMEIDGSYEGKTKFLIVEAKNHFMKDFIIRQLYYPYRVWKKRTSKEIVPVMMIKHDNIYHFYIYEFLEEYNYNSIRLKKVKNYILDEIYQRISLDEIKEIMNMVKIVPEDKEIAFPQADTFARVLDMLDVLYENEFTSLDIQEHYAFAMRQADYYLSATRYLGFVEKNSYQLTELGKRLNKLSKKDKDLLIAKKILEHEPFYDALVTYLKTGKFDKMRIAKMIEAMSGKQINGTTSFRRASTVIGWVRWILSLATSPMEQQTLELEETI